MIYQTKGQWKLNEDTLNYLIVLVTITLCVSILLFKYFILAPVKDYFKNRPQKVKTKIEQTVKKEQKNLRKKKQEKRLLKALKKQKNKSTSLEVYKIDIT